MALEVVEERINGGLTVKEYLTQNPVTARSWRFKSSLRYLESWQSSGRGFLRRLFWVAILCCCRVQVECGMRWMRDQRLNHSLRYLLDHVRQVDNSGN